MDLIYKIYSVWLYPNDPLLNSREDHYFCLIKTSTTINHPSGNIQYLDYYHVIDKLIKSDNSDSVIRNEKIVKTKDFLTLEVLNDREYSSDYKIYNLYWNETKSGINIFDFKHALSFTTKNGELSSYSDLRIFEHAHEREIEKRNLILTSIGI